VLLVSSPSSKRGDRWFHCTLIRLFLVIVELLHSLACTLAWSRQLPQASDLIWRPVRLGLDCSDLLGAQVFFRPFPNQIIKVCPFSSLRGAIRSARKLFLLPFCSCWCLLLICRIFSLSVGRCCSARFAVLPLSVVEGELTLQYYFPSRVISVHGLAENEFMPADRACFLKD